MTSKDLRSKRVVAGIPGHAVCQHSGIPRSRLTGIERGYVTATPDELHRIENAIDQIIHSPAIGTPTGNRPRDFTSRSPVVIRFIDNPLGLPIGGPDQRGGVSEKGKI